LKLPSFTNCQIIRFMVKGRCAAYAADRGPEMTLTSELPGRMARLACLFGLLGLLSGCVVYSVADTAVSTTASVAGTAVSTTAKVAGGAVDLVIPDDDDEEDD
jgi:hypothetical protein